MLSLVRQVLDHRMTLAEWVGTAVMLLAPYGVVGVVFAVLSPGHFAYLDGLRQVLAFVGTAAFWPVLLLANLCAL